ncbi:MAG: LacI family transcriptional regulator [Thermoanaerobacteraceae bacterium]|nr:LacI family transcriptional regulator [Thermoanaerobacteraceae bacterium]
MSYTIYDVAKKAGVSIATVSRVLNNSRLVSEKTQQKVKRVIEELNYTPNIIASALTKKSTLTIGLLIPDISNPFYSELSRGVEDASNDFNFNTVICNTDYCLRKEAAYINLLRQKSVDGFIITTAHYNDENAINLAKDNIPLVLLDRNIEKSDEYDIDVVHSDNVAGGYLAPNHLIQLGHKSIACFLGPPQIEVNLEREKGYIKAMKEANLKISPKLVVYGDFKLDFGYKKTINLLNGNIKPTAFFAANDLIALGIIRALKSVGLSVPSDISVVGYDNTILAELTDPPLTTINQPIREMGYHATELLIKKLKGERSTSEKIIFNTELIIRKSTSVCNKQE